MMHYPATKPSTRLARIKATGQRNHAHALLTKEDIDALAARIDTIQDIPNEDGLSTFPANTLAASTWNSLLLSSEGTPTWNTLGEQWRFHRIQDAVLYALEKEKSLYPAFKKNIPDSVLKIQEMTIQIRDIIQAFRNEHDRSQGVSGAAR